jgi:hypothetical protein
MKTYGGADVQIHIFLPRYYFKVSGHFHVLAALLRRKECPLDKRLRGP